MHWFLDPIQQHYLDFEGRIGRQEFWMYALCVFGINVVINILNSEVLSMIAALALLVPNLAMGTRRLHDTGRSGWWQLIALIPIIGWIVLIIWLAEDTTQADNMYGKPATAKIVNGSVVSAPVSTPPPVVNTPATPGIDPTPSPTQPPISTPPTTEHLT